MLEGVDREHILHQYLLIRLLISVPESNSQYVKGQRMPPTGHFTYCF